MPNFDYLEVPFMLGEAITPTILLGLVEMLSIVRLGWHVKFC